MHLTKWLQQLEKQWSRRVSPRRGRSGRAHPPTRRRVRPHLEVLEDRLTPSSSVGLTGGTVGLTGGTVGSLSGDTVVIGTTYVPNFITNHLSGAIAISLLDSHGNQVSAPGTTFQLSSSSSGGQFRDLSGAIVTSVTIPGAAGSNSNSALFEYEDSQQGTPTITATVSNNSAMGAMATTSDNSVTGHLAITVNPELSITSTAFPIQFEAPLLSPGQQAPFTVQLANGVAASDETFSLHDSSGSGQFLDPATGKSETSITIHKGFASASFLYQNSQAQQFGADTIEVKAGSSHLAQQQVFVGSSAIVTPSQSITTGGATDNIRIRFANSVTSSLTINLQSTSSTGTFLDADGHALPVSNGSAVLTIGQDGVGDFRYQDTATGTAFITATNASDGSRVGEVFEYFREPLPTTATIVSPTQTLTTNQASGPITVELLNDGNDFVTPVDVTVKVLTSSSMGVFNGPVGQNTLSLTIPAGHSSASFTYQDSQEGFPFLSLITPANPSVFCAPPQVENVGGVVLGFTTLPEGFQGDTTLELFDKNGSPVTTAIQLDILLSTNLGSGVQFLDVSGQNPLPTSNGFTNLVIPAGSNSVGFKFTTQPAGEDPVITALLVFPNTGNAPSSIAAKTGPTKLVFLTPPQTVAPNQMSMPVTIELEYTDGTLATVPMFLTGAFGRLTVEVSTPPEDAYQFFDLQGNPLPTNTNGGNFPTVTIPGGSSTASFLFEANQTGQHNIHVSGNEFTATGDQVQNIQVPPPPAPPPSPPPSSPPTSSPPPAPTPPPINPPPLLAVINGLFGGGTETVNADGSATVTDNIGGFPLLVASFDASGNLTDVTIFGIDVTFVFDFFAAFGLL